MNNRCYLCGKSVDFFMEKNGFHIYRCASCGLARTELNRDYDQFVKEHYNAGYFTGDPTRSAYVDYKDDKKYIVRNMRQFLNKIAVYKKSGTLLDVGCALGFFVELARARGYDARGFDPSDYAVGEARKLVGDRFIKPGSISSVTYPKKSFDIITLFDVFEHLHDPSADIEKLVSYLKDDGILVIATGNTRSMLARVLKRRWTFYIPPQHLFFFNKENMQQFLTKHSVHVVEWFHINKWLSLRYVLHLARTTGESAFAHFLYKVVRRARFDHFPLYIPSGDNIVAIIKKN